MLQLFMDQLDPWRLCDREGTISGKILIFHFTRLAPLLADQEGSTQASFRFYKDSKRRGHVEGHVLAELHLNCQRCLGAVAYNVDTKFDLLFTQGPEESAQVPEGIDYLLVEAGEGVVLRDLIEDELLLAIPDAPTHEQIDCIDLENINSNGNVAIEVTSQVEDNPFSILESLKNK